MAGERFRKEVGCCLRVGRGSINTFRPWRTKGAGGTQGAKGHPMSQSKAHA
jgi:hypothetical protein